MKTLLTKSLVSILLIFAMVIAFASCDALKNMLGGNNSNDGNTEHIHEYTEEITKAPSCAEAGEKTFTCSCGDFYTEAVEKLSHVEKVVPAVDATCSSTGLTEGKVCELCNAVLVEQTETPLIAHTYDEGWDADCNVCGEIRTCAHDGEKTTVAGSEPSCEKAGFTDGEKCAICGDVTKNQEVIPALGHDMVKDAAKAPTCSEDGLTEGSHCSRCDKKVEQQVDPALGHDMIIDKAVDATCTATGLTEGSHCSRCDYKVAQEEVEALGHDMVKDDAKAPTCTEDGLTEGSHCSRCDYKVAQEVDPALGHDMIIDKAVDATCTATGLTEGSHCSRCDYKIAQEEVEALGHKGGTATCKDSKVCDVCGNSYGTPDKINGHSYGEANCDSPATCKLCGQTSGEAIGHADDNKDHKCDRCQAEQGTHDDADKNHTCDYGCSEPIGACEDTDSDHKCDYGCAKVFGEHSDSDKNHTCDYGCKGAIGEHKDGDADQDHNCDYCGNYVEGEECVDENKNHKCDECFGAMGEHADSDGDGDHLCDYCNGAVEGEECKGGTATCTSKAVCSECGNEYGEKLAHTYDQSVASEQTIKSAATCEASAVYYYSCSCGEVNKSEDAKTFEYGEALGHDMVKDAAKAPTCTEDGLTEGSHCSRCDYKVDQEVDPALGHDMIIDKAVDATCTEDGLTEGSHCSRCDHKVAQDVVPAIGHQYDDDFDATCNNCDYVRVIVDTTLNKLVNGGFENGLEGWTVIGNIGNVSSDTHYWLNDPERAEGYAFGMDGNGMFSAYVPGAEERAVGTLTSSSFVIGGSGFVTFKVGAMRDGNYVYIDVVDAGTKEILARYYNGLWADRTDDVKSGCTLIAYKADLSAFAGREVFFRISDNADSGYGLFFVDSFVTYYESEPEGFNVATPVNYAVSGTIYDVFNGGFELGDVQGWWNIGEIGLVTNANGYWGDNIPYDKVGEFLFTGVESFGADTMREGNKGTLTSSVFEIGGSGWISFKLGGGGNEFCYVQVIDAITGEVLARYRQQAQQDAKLIQYVADLSAHIGRVARIQVVDLAVNGWGCVSFDNVVTYYASKDALPAGITADNIFHGNYAVNNGSFENGLDGWHQNIWEHGAHGTLGWVESSEHDAGWYTKNDGRKDGNNIFTFCRPDGTNCENTKGELVSSTFTLKQNSFVSFRFGAAGSREVRVELVRADGTVIATFYNEAPGKVNTEMYAYYYQYTGETTDCFFRVVDDSVSNYGCVVVDDFKANLESAPEGFIPAIQ